ncbi:unnamed protein product [Pedinophyceae sp. YPF-701]|nr:unnamed protein product [Pedinophyceae sp. YPF-701]
MVPLRALLTLAWALLALASPAYGQVTPQTRLFTQALLAGDPQACTQFLTDTGIGALGLPQAALNPAIAGAFEPVQLVQQWRAQNFADTLIFLWGNYVPPGVTNVTLKEDVNAAVRSLERQTFAGAPYCDVACQAQQRAALQALYVATNGPTWANDRMRTIWASDIHHCCWPGVHCCTAVNTIPFIRYDGTGAPADLVDSRIRALGCLQKGGVVSVDLSRAVRGTDAALRRPGGALPPGVLGALRTSLEYLNLRALGLTGTVPPDILSAAWLRVVHVEQNQFSGSLPEAMATGLDPLNPAWAALPLLRGLHVNDNRFTGPIPNSLALAVGLQRVMVANNEFDNLPSTLPVLPNLHEFDAANNKLTNVYQRPANLVAGPLSGFDLDLWDDFGTIYTESTGLVNGVNLRNNAINDNITPDIAFLSYSKLDCGENFLVGSIPPTIGLSPRVREVLLDNNDFSGPLPEPLTDWNMEVLRASRNPRVTGTFPATLPEVLTLRDVRLDNTALYGPIPDAMGDLENLQRLDIQSTLVTHDPRNLNSRGEPLPEWLRFDPSGLARVTVSPVSSVPGGVGVELQGAPEEPGAGGAVRRLLGLAPRGRRAQVDLSINLLCPQLQWAGASETVAVSIDPLYHHYEGCRCPEGFELFTFPLASATDLFQRFEFARTFGSFAWVPSLRPNTPEADEWLRAHVPERVPTCTRVDGDDGLSTAEVVIIAIVGAVAVLLIVALIIVLLLRQQIAVALLERRKRAGPPTAGREATLVLTDVADSTNFWEELPEQMAQANAMHDAILRKHLARWHGYEVTTEGDSFLLAFHEPSDAVGWCIMVQQDLMAAEWPGLIDDKTATTNAVQRRSVVSKSGGGHSRSTASSGATGGPRSQGTVSASGSAALSGARSAPPRSHTSTGSDAAADVTEDFVESCGPQLFRGLLVRMSVATAMVRHTAVHRVTRRLEYSGDCVTLVNDIQEMAHGGQILVCERTMEVLARSSLKTLYHSIMDARPAKALSAFLAKLSQTNGNVRWGNITTITSQNVRHSAGENDKSVDNDKSSVVRVSDVSGSLGEDVAAMRNTPSQGLFDEAKMFMGNGRVPPLPPGKASNGAVPDGDIMVLDMGEVAAEGTAETSPIHVFQILVPLLEERARFLPALQGKAITPGYLDAPGAHAPLSPFTSLCTHFIKYNDCHMCKDLVVRLPEVVIVFCTPVGMSSMMNEQPVAARRALRMYSSAVRRTLPQFNGYECQELDSSFMLAFADMSDAMLWAVSLQALLPTLPWPSKFLQCDAGRARYQPGGGWTPGGIRVKVGACKGRPLRIVPHTTTGRADYFGPLVNRAARMCFAAAQPGQVVGAVDQLAAGLANLIVDDHITVGTGAGPDDACPPAEMKPTHDVSRRSMVGRVPFVTALIPPDKVGKLERVVLCDDDALLSLCGAARADLEALPDVAPEMLAPLSLNTVMKEAADVRETDKENEADGAGQARPSTGSQASFGVKSNPSSGVSGRSVGSRAVRFNESGISAQHEAVRTGMLWSWNVTRRHAKLDHIGRYRLKGVQGEFELACIYTDASGSQVPGTSFQRGRKGTMLAPPGGNVLEADVLMPEPVLVAFPAGRSRISGLRASYMGGSLRSSMASMTFGAGNGDRLY